MPEKAIGTNTLPTIRNWVVSLIPTLTSQLTNDSDFITETDAETYIDNAVRNAKNIWYGQCATAAGTLEKVVSTVSSSTNPFVWRKGSIIVVEFFNGVSGITQGTAVTLNVDGTGAKNVLLYTGELVYNGAWQPFETVIFAVDDTSFMMLGKARATTSSYGVTMLSSDTNSSSQLLAATPKAVKDALTAAKSYADGIGATIPTNTSDLNNDSGFITGTNITVNGDDYPIVYRGYTELSGVTGLLIHYDDGTLEGGNVFLPDGDAMNDVAQGIIAQIPTQYAGSPTAGGTANKAASIPYAQVDDTSTSTAYTATVPGITELVDGTTVMLRNAKVTSASGFTIDINGLGAKPCYSNMATGNPITPTAPTRETTIFNINYTMIFVYSEDLVEGGCWICYRGYDNNTNTIGYQVRTNSSTLPASDKFYRYRLLFTSADGTHFVPSNTSSSTNATTARATNTRPIDPHGSIVYYGTTAAVEANANPGAALLWQQYTMTLGYAFNTAGGTLTLSYPAPVYLRCNPQTDGSAVMEDIVQALPTTDDGKIYIFLGRAYSATAIELTVNHPIYFYKNSAIRLWTGP